MNAFAWNRNLRCRWGHRWSVSCRFCSFNSSLHASNLGKLLLCCQKKFSLISLLVHACRPALITSSKDAVDSVEPIRKNSKPLSNVSLDMIMKENSEPGSYASMHDGTWPCMFQMPCFAKLNRALFQIALVCGFLRSVCGFFALDLRIGFRPKLGIRPWKVQNDHAWLALDTLDPAALDMDCVRHQCVRQPCVRHHHALDTLCVRHHVNALD